MPARASADSHTPLGGRGSAPPPLLQRAQALPQPSDPLAQRQVWNQAPLFVRARRQALGSAKLPQIATCGWRKRKNILGSESSSYT
jgi:hypothetical protein